MLAFKRSILFFIFVAGGPYGISGILEAAYRSDVYMAPPSSVPVPSDRLRHDVNNQAEEIRVLYARLATQETLMESLRDDIHKMGRSSLEASQSESKNAQARISDLELKVEGLEKQLAKTTDLLNYSQRRLETFDSSLEQHTKNSRQLEKSLGTLLEAVGSESSSNDLAGADTYRVVAGDSLEKIARRHKTTVQVLKNLNGLSDDRIIVGKKLKVPPAAA